MVPSIARQSVIIKCNMQKSILTGNYEFYYAAGLIAKLSGVEIPEDIKPEELLALLSEQIPMLTPADEKEKYLFGMVADYRPEDVYDEQMRELLDTAPGSVSVLGLMNDRENRVQLVMDAPVAESGTFGCHPCRNTSSLRLRTADLLETILPAIHHTPIFVHL